VLNTAVGVRSIPQDYLNVGRVLKLPRTKMLRKVIIPATLPYVFTGCRLSLGIAWLVIAASEMLTGAPGVGGFLWQEYNPSSVPILPQGEQCPRVICLLALLCSHYKIRLY